MLDSVYVNLARVRWKWTWNRWEENIVTAIHACDYTTSTKPQNKMLRINSISYKGNKEKSISSITKLPLYGVSLSFFVDKTSWFSWKHNTEKYKDSFQCKCDCCAVLIWFEASQCVLEEMNTVSPSLNMRNAITYGMWICVKSAWWTQVWEMTDRDRLVKRA